MKTIALMQPYLFPYIGYWQLISSVDLFVIYDNIEYTKKGWFNRNRILVSGNEWLFTVPIRKDSDFLNVDQRFLAEASATDIDRILRVIETNYKKAPYFADTYPLVEECFKHQNKNLFGYILNSVKEVCDHLGIRTEIKRSSEVVIDHTLKSEKKVIAICKELGADTYINPIGGKEIYEHETFSSNGIDLRFIQPRLTEYNQFNNKFVPGLSIIDVMMFNSKSGITQYLKDFTLL